VAATACGSVALADHCSLQYNMSLGTPGPAVLDSFTSNYVTMFRASDVGSPGTKKLFVGGSFDSIGGVAGTTGIATWDGASFAPVGHGLYLIDMVPFGDPNGSPSYRTPQVNAAIEFQGALYIGGQFDGADTGVISRGAIRWTGTAYESINLKDVDVGAYTVWCFAIYKGELYAGGNFPTMGSAVGATSIAKYDLATNDWSAVAGSVTSTANVFDLAVYNDGTGEKLYACGNFTLAGLVAGTKHIAAFDGTSWSNVGGGYQTSGASAYARDLVVFDDGTGPALYAAGGLALAFGNATFSPVNRWDGKSWKSIPGFLDDPAVSSVTVRNMGLYNDGTGTTMLADARFFIPASGGNPSQARAKMARFENFRFNEIAASAVGNDTSGNSSISEMYQYDDGSGSKLFIGGSFQSINGVAANRIATITGCTSAAAGCPADFNQTGHLEVADIFDFLNAWFAGCP
jgi:hypothetical protein